jgi:chemotaxis protein histidine kinase CheA/ActR/RegA family two-component response regulator
VTASSAELYDLFLTLAPMRLSAARDALLDDDEPRRTVRLASALLPLAVDALLLGADGVADLARAVAESAPASNEGAAAAVDALEASASALGSGDESGARIDESALKRHAEALRGGAAPAAARSRAPQAGPTSDERDWVPQVAEEMVGAFLDECNERVDALAEKLLVLEQQRDDKELISALFRDLHTLKGSSAFAGLARMNRVAHAAEDLVAQLRSGERIADRPVVDALLAALDALRAILERAQRRAAIDVDVAPVLHALRHPAAASAASIAASLEAPEARDPTGDGGGRSAAPAKVGQGGAGTLRIEFEKVDLLLNLVGELVLARGRLAAAAERHATVPQELAQLRRQLLIALDGRGDGERLLPRHAGAVTWTTHATSSRSIAEDLQRTERVLGESYGDLDGGLTSLGQALGQLRDQVMKLRMVPITRLFTKYQRTVRELSHKLGKEVRVELQGADTELDKVLVERLDDPLLHLVRNAIDHGIESPEVRTAAGKPPVGTLQLIARQRGGSILVAIRDDGAGMDARTLKARAIEKGILDEATAAAMPDREAFELIFRAGFSTAQQVSDVSGRGVGMDVVRQAIAALKGTVVVESQKGHGTTIELRLPLTLAIGQVLAVRVGAEVVAIPLDAVVSTSAVDPAALEVVADSSTIRVAGRLVPVVDLAGTLGLDRSADLAGGAAAYVVVVDVGGELFGLLVQQLLGRHEVVLKSLGALLSNAPFVAGATLVDDRVLLLIDLVAVTSAASGAHAHGFLAPAAAAPRPSNGKHVLVVEDSDLVREGIRRAFEARGFEVTVAADGAEALEITRTREFDAVTTDIVMPRVDGYELARTLRADPRYARVPLVMLTSKDARIDQLRGLDAGADAYLAKPVDAGDLVRQIEALLARTK